MLDSKAYKEYYAVASGAEPLKEKTKYKKKADEPVTLSKSKSTPAAKGIRLKTPGKVALTEAEQIKLATKRSKNDFHMSHTSGSSDGVDIQSKVPDEQQQKVTGINEGAGVRLEVPDVSKYNSESEEESWTFSQNDEDDVEESYMNDDSEETEPDNDGDDLTHHNLSTYKEDNEEEGKEKVTDDEVSSDQRVYSPPDHKLTKEEENKKGDDEDIEVSVTAETPHSDTTNPQTPIPVIQPLQQTPESTTTTIPTKTFPDIPNFASLFQFDQRVSALETELSELGQIDQFAKAIFSIPSIVDNYLASKMKEAVDVAVQQQTNKLREEAQAENQEFLNQSVNRSDIQKNLYNALVKSYNSDKDIFSSYGNVVTLKRGRYDKEKDEDPSSGSNRGSKRRRLDKEAESSKEPTHKESKSTSSSKDASRSQPKPSGKSAHAEEHAIQVREGDFKRLHRQDTEDMLLLLFQSKLSNLNLEEWYALNVALRMFTRRIVILERVEDLQLGVKSYQKKINLTRPDTYRLDLKRMNPYIAYPDIQRIIYEDEMNRNRLMRTYELLKFSDGTLNHVRTNLNDVAIGIEMDYLPKRK
nr:hypothetical protein [Tanacetum cinerariifolium]